jgi:hypothetical protein
MHLLGSPSLTEEESASSSIEGRKSSDAANPQSVHCHCGPALAA